MSSPSSEQREFEREAARAKGPYGTAAVASTDHSLIRIAVTGDLDPQLPARIFGFLTIRGTLPLHFSLRRNDHDETVEIEIRVRADEVPLVDQLVERLLKIPSVIAAMLLSVRS